MKLTAKVKLQPNQEQQAALLATLRQANQCCDWLSGQAWATKKFRAYDLHHVAYRIAREQFRLGAQVVVRCIAKVGDAYKLDRKRKRSFRALGSVAYDARILKWRVPKQTVPIWSVAGRLNVRFVCRPRQRGVAGLAMWGIGSDLPAGRVLSGGYL